MSEVILPNGWNPRPYQRPLWDYLERGGKRAVVAWHRRAGKDDVILHRTAIAAFERPATYWHCLPSYTQSRRAMWNAVDANTGKRRIDVAFPHELRDNTNDHEMFIRFKNGSTWQLIGSDNYNDLVGAGVAGITFSEYALANPSAWGYMRPMLLENDGWAAFISTPRGHNHFETALKRAHERDDWFGESLSILQTGALTPQQIQESLEEYIDLYGEDYGRAQFEQEYMVNFNAAILGAFYAREMTNVRNEGRICQIEAMTNRPVQTAWDIGVRDDTSIIFFQVVGMQLFILDCYTANGVGVDHYAEVVHKRFEQNRWQRGVDYVPHDAQVTEWGTGRTRIETMEKYGLKPVRVPDVGKIDGINATRRTLPLCVFHPDCEENGLIPALEQYRREWDDEKKTFKASEVHDWTSHLSDAMRYLSLAWKKSAPDKPVTDRTPPPGMVRPPPLVQFGRKSLLHGY